MNLGLEGWAGPGHTKDPPVGARKSGEFLAGKVGQQQLGL